MDLWQLQLEIAETLLPIQAENVKLLSEKSKIPRMQEIHMIWSTQKWSGKWVVKWQIGGAHRMAVSQHFVSEIECTQSKISTCDIYLSNFYQLFPVRDQMKAQEGLKVKFACFKGIVDPTDFQVSWGTWLGFHPLCRESDLTPLFHPLSALFLL